MYDYYEQIKIQLADMVVLIRTGLIFKSDGRRWEHSRSSTSTRATS